MVKIKHFVRVVFFASALVGIGSLTMSQPVLATDACNNGFGGCIRLDHDTYIGNFAIYSGTFNDDCVSVSGTFGASYCTSTVSNIVNGSDAWNACYQTGADTMYNYTVGDVYWDGYDQGQVTGYTYCCSDFGLNC